MHGVPGSLRTTLALCLALAALRESSALTALAADPSHAPGQKPGAALAHKFPLVVERNVPMRMRDGTVLRADVWRPAGPTEPQGQATRRPVLLCRTPYGKDSDPDELRFAQKAVERGYVVVIQDVRGRFASAGDFDPHVHEGRDGYDSIEWAASQPWSDGRVGLFGLSYPGCAQWLAAVEQPPHLLAMAPAMSFSRLRDCIYYGGAFDGDWVRWAWLAIAPDARVRNGLPGARTPLEAWREWQSKGSDALMGHLPLAEIPELREAAPFFAQWLTHPPYSPWWGFADLGGKYEKITTAVLHLDGWQDDAYGPKGAIANHLGLTAARAGQQAGGPPRSLLVLGPWAHGIPAITGEAKPGSRDFGPQANLDYDTLVLDFMDLHVRGLKNHLEQAAPVRYFVMGSNQWRESTVWPPPAQSQLALHFDGGPQGASGGTGMGSLTGDVEDRSPPDDQMRRPATSSFVNDPAHPVRELPSWAMGFEDQRSLLEYRGDLLAFQTAPLREDVTVAGNIRAELFISTDAPDVDLYVLLQDVAEDGTAYPLMDPGAAVLRASLRHMERHLAQGKPATPQLLEPGTIYRLDIDTLVTANTFHKGDRIRVIVCASWFPGLTRNLQTGQSEATTSALRPARITLHHDAEHASRLVLPVLAPALTEEPHQQPLPGGSL